MNLLRNMHQISKMLKALKLDFDTGLPNNFIGAYYQTNEQLFTLALAEGSAHFVWLVVQL